MERIGLLAGAGKLPVECAKAAKLLGYEVYAVALLPETDAELKECTADCQSISIAHLDAVLNYLKEHQVSKVTMIGKVTKELLFSGKVQPDARMLKLIMELPDRKDDTIMMMFVRELAKAGIQAFDQTALIRRLMPHRGVITKREPTAEERVLRFLQKNAVNGAFRPSVSISAIAEALCIGRTTLYRALDTLEQKGLIKKDGRLFRLPEGDTK